MPMKLTMISLLVSMNKITFFIKFNKAISSGYTFTIIYNTNTFDKTVLLEMRIYLPQINILNLIHQFCSLIEQLQVFFQDQIILNYLRRDSKILSFTKFIFHDFKIFSKLIFIFFKLQSLVSLIRSSINQEYRIYPEYQFQEL